MSVTYSINVGQTTEATRKSDIYTVLQDLPDNTSKLISPRDVRDAFLSTWANSAFKITTPSIYSTYEYIGVDSGNPSNRDIKSKILLGKRMFGNLDIMNNSLLNSSQADIFIYNTKSDSVTQSSTRMAILAGTNSLLHLQAPYFESTATGSGTTLDIVNPSYFDGPINIISQQGVVALNGIAFPTFAETSGSASNGRILRYYGVYPNGYLRWEDPTFTVSSIGVPGITTSIYGSPVNINGYSLEFVDTNLVPTPVGDFKSGDTFNSGSFNGQDWPLSEVIRKILYPYIEPELNISLVNQLTGTNLAAIGTTPSISFTYSIKTFARNSQEDISDFHFRFGPGPRIIHYGSSFSATPSTSMSGSFIYSTYSSVRSTQNYSLVVSTVTGSTSSLYPTGYSFSATASLRFILPSFYGFNSSLINNQTTLDAEFSNLSQLAIDYPGLSQSVSVSATGSGYLYFMYPSTTFGSDVKYIKDPNGFYIHDYNYYPFSSFGTTLSPYQLITSVTYGVNYKVWRTIATCSYTGGGQFDFKF
jgi:hypothetical protein